MPIPSGFRLLAACGVLALHALAFTIAGAPTLRFANDAEPARREAMVLRLDLLTPPPETPAPAPEPAPATPAPPAPLPIEVPRVAPVTPTLVDRRPASQAAPAAPTAEEWALAGTYTLKNSKRYRYHWGVQVRSMMGTAIEGPDQGLVRFRVEIAPDGTLARLDTLWSTSAAAERLARQAIAQLPPLPATPTGQPLIFDRTISFSPFAPDGAPVYRGDCIPDPPAFRNPFAWDGKSPQVRAAPPAPAKLDPAALEECLRLLPRDTLEAEVAQDQRVMDQWGTVRRAP